LDGGGFFNVVDWTRQMSRITKWSVSRDAYCILLFVVTILFAWNAARGDNSNPRFLFSDPGVTVIVLQLLTNATAMLLGEMERATFEMVYIYCNYKILTKRCGGRWRPQEVVF
jgi:hypothetical protein